MGGGGDAGFSEVIVVTTTIPPGYGSERARASTLSSLRLAKLNFVPRAEDRVTKTGEKFAGIGRELCRADSLAEYLILRIS